MNQVDDYRYRIEALSAEVEARTERVLAEVREDEARFQAQAQESFAQMLELVNRAQQSEQSPPAPVRTRRPEDDEDVDFSDIDWVNR